MCWSSQVSLCFASLDTCFIALLLAKAYSERMSRNKKRTTTLAGTYAALMTCIAVQEWAQYGVWIRSSRRGEESPLSCSGSTDVLLGILTTGAAESVPLPVIASSFLTRRQANNPSQSDYRSSMRQASLVLWVMQFLIVALSAIATKKYCVELGENSHQVWTCESAPYQAGGQLLHHAFYWGYVVSSLCAAESLDMPRGERRRLQGIGLISAIVSIVLYGKTLEACSIWCWSAFVLGIYLCAEVYGYIEEFSCAPIIRNTKGVWSKLIHSKIREGEKLSRSLHNGSSSARRRL